MPRRFYIIWQDVRAFAVAVVLTAGLPGLGIAQTDTAVLAAELQLDAQTDQWMLDHLATWLRANGCTISRDRQQDFQDGVLGLVLDGLQVPSELHAELMPAADERMQRAAEAWEASGKTFEDLGLIMDDEAETLRVDPC